MNVLSLFDGISVGHLALIDAGVKVDNYWASEVNKASIKVTQHHFPDTVQLGDVCNWKEWDIPWNKIDLLIGGSPCFKAGTKVLTKDGYKNIEDIVEGEEVLTHLNRWKKVVRVGSTPNKEIWKIKTRYGLKFYTTSNHPFFASHVENLEYTVPRFKAVDKLSTLDYLIGLSDMSGSENVDYEYDRVVKVEKTDRVERVYNLEVEEDHTYIVNGRIVHNCQNISLSGDKKGLDGEKSKLFFVYRDILNYLRSVNPNILFLLENVKGKKEVLNEISKELGVEPVRINSNLVSAQNRDRFYWTNISNQIAPPDDKGLIMNDILDPNADGTFPLSKVHYQAFLKSYPNWKDSSRMGKSKPILATYYKQPPHCPYIKDSLSESGYRRLTPLECERLQTLPDNYTDVGIATGRRYECIGNGWTMKVLSHIFGYIEKEKELQAVV